jgi:hypothetical protein
MGILDKFKERLQETPIEGSMAERARVIDEVIARVQADNSAWQARRAAEQTARPSAPKRKRGRPRTKRRSNG